MKPPYTNGIIPTFGLYGEPTQRQQPEFVHIEDIATRSSQHGWEIRPHRHGKLYQLLFLYEGQMEVCLDEENLNLAGTWAISIPAGCVHGFRFPADTRGAVLTVQEPLLASRQDNGHFGNLLQTPQAIHFAPGDTLLQPLKQHLALLQGEFGSMETGHGLMLQWLVNMVLMTLKRQREHRHNQSLGQGSGHGDLLPRFRALLEQHYRAHWGVRDYAQALHTSVSSLNRCCQQRAGASAKTLIQERMLLEIKRRLIYTREPLDRVAYTLGFKDPSYFSRFFRQLEGSAPSAYRRDKYFETGTTF